MSSGSPPYANGAPTPADPSVDGPEGQTAKRRRINFACNYCRNRKTRCDEQKPSCRACIAAGIECVTTDRRRPGVEVQRRETKRRMSRASTSSLPHSSVLSCPSPQSATDGSVEDAIRRRDSIPLTGEPGHENRSAGPAKPATEKRDVTIAEAIPEDEEATAGQGSTKFQGKLPVVRPSRGSTSVEILADWLDLASRRLGLQHRRGLPPCADTSTFRHRTRAMLCSQPPAFPPAGSARLLAARFFDGVNVLYPLLSSVRFQQDLDVALGSNPFDFAETRGVAVLAQMYLVWAIGFSAEPLLDSTVSPKEYLDYCKTLLGHLVIDNNVENVRAIVLLALCLHCYDDCAGAWNSLGVGVSMAMSLGLHKPRTCRRKSTNRKPDALEGEEKRVFWLGIYAFEKLLAFEMGHLSSINDEECYPPHVQDLPTYTEAETSSRGKAFAVTVDLAKILSDIGRKSAIVSRKEDGVSGPALQAVITEKVQTTGEAKLLLTRWGESVPDELRPTSDILIGSRICPFASFISMHYNNALVILSRNSLLISEEAISSGANIIAKGKPWDYFVRNGQSIAANAARKMLRILVETLDSKSNSIYPSLLTALHALATLVIHVVTHPDSRISSMDFHLIQTATDSMKEVYSRLPGDGLFNCLLQKLDGILQQATPAPSRLTQPAVYVASDDVEAQHNPWSQQHQGSSEAAGRVEWSGRGQADMANADGAPGISAAPVFGQNYVLSGGNGFGYDSLGSMTLPGDEWSPSLSDGVGWDWACFSQLLTDQFQPQ